MKKSSKKKAGEKISRQDALKKAGKYAMYTAVVSMLLLTPKKAIAGS